MKRADKGIPGASTHSRLKEQRASVRYVIIAVLIVVTGYLGNYFLRAEKFNIHDVLVQGVANVDSRGLEAIATRSLAGNYAWLFPRANIFTYSKLGISKQALKSYPRIAELKLNVQNNKLMLGVVEHPESIKWCYPNLESLDCYFLTSEGAIFTKSTATSSNSFYYYDSSISGSWATESPIGKLVIKKERMENANEIVARLPRLDLGARYVDVSTSEYTKLILTEGWYIIYRTSDTPDTVVSNLTIVLGSSQVASQKNNLEYIDMRFGSKLYYKFKAYTDE